MSQVHYKFKSSKDYDSITFDGHSISVFDLKREILIAKGLKGNDDLALTHADTGEEYHDDAKLIPRNTRVLVARVPGKAGRSGAQKYLEGTGPTPRGGSMARNVFDRHHDSASHNSMNTRVFKNTQMLVAPDDGPPPPAVDTSNMTEEEAIKNMFQQSTAVWDKTQEAMANAPYRRLPKFPMPTKSAAGGGAGSATGANASGGGGGEGGGAGFSSGGGAGGSGSYQRGSGSSLDQQQRPPPSNYVCFRCGQKGHWIQFCPTNSDKSFEPIGVKRTTGIPRSFLKTVEQVPANGKKGVMVTQDGNLVVATTNDSAWKKFHEKSKGSLTSDDLYATAPVAEELKCPICQQLLRNAVRTPCCQSIYCDECINNHLVHPPRGETPLKCHRCRKDLVPDQLIPSLEYRQRVDAHLKDWAKRRYNTENDSVPPGSSHTLSGSSNQATVTTSGNKSPSKEAGAEREEGSQQQQQQQESSGKDDGPSLPKRSAPQDGHRSGGDHSGEHTNKRPNTGYNSSGHRHQPHQGMNNFNPMMNMPPEMFGMMGDPAMFMDPAFLAANGMNPFFMPGFTPHPHPNPANPFGGPADFGQGLPAISGIPSMANLLGQQPGFQGIPRVGFGDSGRGRGRGGAGVGTGAGRGGGQQQGHGRGGPMSQQQGSSSQHQQHQLPPTPQHGAMNGVGGAGRRVGGTGGAAAGGGGGASGARSLSPSHPSRDGPSFRDAGTASPRSSLAPPPALSTSSTSRGGDRSSSRQRSQSRDRGSSRDRDRDYDRDYDRDRERDRDYDRDRDRRSRDRSRDRSDRDYDRDRDRDRGDDRSRDSGSRDRSNRDRSYDRDRGYDRDRERDRDRGRDRDRERDRSRDRRYGSKGDRDDHDIDMSQVPKGPRGDRRSPMSEDDIPTGPRAGVGPDDDDQTRRRSMSPSTTDRDGRRGTADDYSQDHHRGGGSRRGTDEYDHQDDRRSSRSQSRDYLQASTSTSSRHRSNSITSSSSRHDRSRERPRSRSPVSSSSHNKSSASRSSNRHRDDGRDRDRDRDRDYRHRDRDRDRDRERDRGRDDRDRRKDDNYGSSSSSSSKKQAVAAEMPEEEDLFKTGLISSSARERERERRERERERARRAGY